MSPSNEPKADQVVARLRSHMTEMQGELMQLKANQTLWRTLDSSLLNRASDTPSVWLSHYRFVYSQAQVIGLRRFIQGDTDKGHVTLVRVLNTLLSRPDSIDVRHFNSLSDACPSAIRARMETEWLAKSGLLNTSIPNGDIKALTESESAKKILHWGNHHVAHIYPTEPIRTIAPPAFSDIDSVLKSVGDIYSRYHELLFGTYLHEDHIVLQSNWANSFDRPLFDQV